MRKFCFRLRIITEWLRASERATRYKRQRDVLHRHYPWPYTDPDGDLCKVIGEIRKENASSRK